jgi:hypothetical protein
VPSTRHQRWLDRLRVGAVTGVGLVRLVAPAAASVPVRVGLAAATLLVLPLGVAVGVRRGPLPVLATLAGPVVVDPLARGLSGGVTLSAATLRHAYRFQLRTRRDGGRRPAYGLRMLWARAKRAVEST